MLWEMIGTDIPHAHFDDLGQPTTPVYLVARLPSALTVSKGATGGGRLFVQIGFRSPGKPSQSRYSVCFFPSLELADEEVGLLARAR